MADVILHALVRSRETFSLPAGSQRYFFYSQTCFPVFAWHYVNLFYSLRVWHALFFFSDPHFASLRVWLVLFLFSDPERLPCSPKAACFSSIESELRFVSRFFTHFSTLLHTFFTFIRYLNHCQEEIPIDTISFS